MRLTIHRLSQIPTRHQPQVALIVEGASLPEQAEFYLATFNDRAVALAWRDNTTLTFIAVRDITRRRGIGQELLAQIKLDAKAAGLSQLNCDPRQAQPTAQAGLSAFLQAQGFNASGAMLSCNLD